MKLKRLHLSNFTVFEDNTTIEFSPDVNVLVGENGTGKSHLLKLAYVVTRAHREKHRVQAPFPQGWMATELREVFQPDGLDSFSRVVGRDSVVRAEWDNGDDLSIRITGRSVDVTAFIHDKGPTPAKAVFLPSREVLSIYPGFVAAWMNRESSFDRTYVDLCTALGLRPLRENAIAESVRALVDTLEASLAGKVTVKDDRFYVEYGGGPMEVSMVGEGDRKLAMLVYLLRNGTLEPGGLLAWDEPEASLNPKRARLMSSAAFALAEAGMQVILSTHDYALCSEIDLHSDLAKSRSVTFLGLSRNRAHEVHVESSTSFLGVHENPILDAFGEIHDREEAAMTREDP
jgi:energy-coupling factor transporter ATP-binding protein EcfA2